MKDSLVRLRLKARALVRKNQVLYDLMRLVRHGRIVGIANGKARKALLDRGQRAGWRMLNLGSGGRRERHMINLDVTPVTGPDVVGDGYGLPFADGTFDAIFCDYVIEHVPDPERFLAAAGRALEPQGGVFYLQVPFLQPLHGEGFDFTRWTRSGFAAAAERAGFQVLESGVHIGPTFTLYWILKEWIAALLSLGLPRLRGAVLYVTGWLLAPLLLLDVLMLRLPQAESLANGFFVVLAPLHRPPDAGAGAPRA